MNKCVSKEDNQNKYKNNPWNYTEDPRAYLDRRKLQFDKIIEIVKSGNKDFMLLQEIDSLTKSNFFQNSVDKDEYTALQNAFLTNLKNAGWDMVITAQTEGSNRTTYKNSSLNQSFRVHCLRLVSTD